MARYFFHLEDGNDVLRDNTGAEFPKLGEAIAYAVGVARKVASNRPDRSRIAQALLVTNVEGDTIFSVALLFEDV